MRQLPSINFYRIVSLAQLIGVLVVVFVISQALPFLVQAQTRVVTPTLTPNSNFDSLDLQVTTFESTASGEAETSLEIIDSANYSGISTARPLVIDQERAQIKEQYRLAIQAYSQSYREFTLAKAQFQKLGTLAALEEAVTDTRQVLADRARVLLVFFDLIHLELRAAPGVDPERKQSALREIEEKRANLQAEEQLILNSQDRVAIAARATTFINSVKEMETQAYYVRSLILLGHMYRSYQEALALYSETQQLHREQEVTLATQSQRQRAYIELDALIAQIDHGWSKVMEQMSKEGEKNQSWFQQVVVLLSQQQADIIRLYSFIEELARS